MSPIGIDTFGRSKRRWGIFLISVDVLIRWFGSLNEATGAFLELGGQLARFEPSEVDAEMVVRNVEAERATKWALQHLWEAEIVHPPWIREWIADRLLRRAREYAS